MNGICDKQVLADCGHKGGRAQKARSYQFSFPKEAIYIVLNVKYTFLSMLTSHLELLKTMY